MVVSPRRGPYGPDVRRAIHGDECPPAAGRDTEPPRLASRRHGMECLHGQPHGRSHPAVGGQRFATRVFPEPDFNLATAGPDRRHVRLRGPSSVHVVPSDRRLPEGDRRPLRDCTNLPRIADCDGHLHVLRRPGSHGVPLGRSGSRAPSPEARWGAICRDASVGSRT